MKKDCPTVIRSLCQALNYPLSEKKVGLLANDLSFDNFKKNPSVNKEHLNKKSGETFIRKGAVGDWKNHVSEESANREWDRWIMEKIRHFRLDQGDLEHVLNTLANNKL